MNTEYDNTHATRSERRNRKNKPKVSVGHFLILGVILTVILGVGGYAYYAYYTSTSQYRIEQAFKYIDQADAKLDRINEVIETDITDDAAEKVKEVKDSIEPTRDLLREAASHIKAAQGRAANGDVELLADIQQSIALRGQILGLAPELLEVTEKSANALSGVNAGSTKLKEATEASIAATEAFDKQDKAGMLESVKQNNKALDALARARVEFNDAERVLPGLSFADCIAYIDIREQMAQAAIKAANDWTSDDKTALKVDLETYAKLLVQAQAMEEANLITPVDIVAATYHELVGLQNAEYLDIREQVLTLDKKVR
jgi:hypothetical protein